MVERYELGRRLITPDMRVQLLRMNGEPYPVPTGTCGTVTFVDDINQIHVNWDNGSTLALIPSVDDFFVIG